MIQRAQQTYEICCRLHAHQCALADAGEGQEGVVDSFIQAALSYYGEKGLLDDSPLPIQLEEDKDSRSTTSPLRYPGKLAADLPGDRLFIADSNNHRSVSSPSKGNNQLREVQEVYDLSLIENEVRQECGSFQIWR